MTWTLTLFLKSLEIIIKKKMKVKMNWSIYFIDFLKTLLAFLYIHFTLMIFKANRFVLAR